jgi:hypothetical protein
VDHFVNRLADLYFDVVSLADNTNVNAAKLTQKIERWLGLLAHGQP